MSQENTPNNQEITPEAYKALQAELEAARAAAAQQVEQATHFKERIASLEAEVGSKTKDIEAIKGQVAEKDKSFASLSASFEGAVGAYRSQVLKANPLVPPEMVLGNTIADIDQATEKATAMVAKIKEGVTKEIQQTTVPAGAPGRTPPDTSTMTTREKITHGVTARKKGG